MPFQGVSASGMRGQMLYPPLSGRITGRCNALSHILRVGLSPPYSSTMVTSSCCSITSFFFLYLSHCPTLSILLLCSLPNLIPHPNNNKTNPTPKNVSQSLVSGPAFREEPKQTVGTGSSNRK